MRGRRHVSSKVPLADLGEAGERLCARLGDTRERSFHRSSRSSDGEVVSEARRLVQSIAGARAHGWDDAAPGASAVCESIDWPEHSRAVWAASLREASDARAHAGEILVGEPGDRRHAVIPDAPLFSDARPNADIFSRR